MYLVKASVFWCSLLYKARSIHSLFPRRLLMNHALYCITQSRVSLGMISLKERRCHHGRLCLYLILLILIESIESFTELWVVVRNLQSLFLFLWRWSIIWTTTWVKLHYSIMQTFFVFMHFFMILIASLKHFHYWITRLVWNQLWRVYLRSLYH